MRAPFRWIRLLPAIVLTLIAPQAHAQRTTVVTTLVPVELGFSDAEGEAEFEASRRENEFEIELEDLPDGEYALAVNGVIRGTVLVDRGDGEIAFSTDPRRDELLLDFDPDGALIEIVQNDRVVMAGLARFVGAEAPEARFPRQNLRERFEVLDPEQGDRVRLQARFRSASKRAELRIDGRRLVDGVYTLVIDGQEVVSVETTRGRFRERFSTTPRRNQLPLTFDPSSATIELVRNDEVAFTTTLEGTPLGVGVTPLGELVRPMRNTGLIPSAEGELELRVKPGETEFEVEIEDLPAGSYGVLVDGLEVGSVTVLFTGETTEGEIEFTTDPDDPFDVLLGFDPLGRTIEVVNDDGLVVLDLFFDGALTPGDGLDDDDVDDDDD